MPVRFGTCLALACVRYERTKVASDAPTNGKIRELALRYPGYGYRRVQIFMGRECFPMCAARAYRLWNLELLQLPRMLPHRLIADSCLRPFASGNANQVGSYDYLFDAYANGQQLKCMTIVDESTRECLAVDVTGSIRSKID